MMVNSGHNEGSVSAVIVNFKSASHVVRCVESLRNQEGVSLEIIVVDNDSGEDEVARLTTALGDSAALIANPENYGFAKANNIGASRASGEYVLVINPDAEFCGIDGLARLLVCLEKNPQLGLVGPRIDEPEKGKQDKPKLHYPYANLLRQTFGLDALPGEIAWLLGACLLMRKSTFDALGGFDEDFFLYGEDVDLSLRTRKAGLLLGYCPDSQVRHVGGASAATMPSLSKFILKKRGLFLFCRKHYAESDVRRIAWRMRISSKAKLLALSLRKACGMMSEERMLKDATKWQAELQVAEEVLHGSSPSRGRNGTVDH